MRYRTAHLGFHKARGKVILSAAESNIIMPLAYLADPWQKMKVHEEMEVNFPTSSEFSISSPVQVLKFQSSLSDFLGCRRRNDRCE